MGADEIDVETHFVENPFIRARERASKNQLNAKQMLSGRELEEDNADEDIIILKDQGGKLEIRDLEQTEIDKAKAKKRKRDQLVVDDESESEDAQELREKIKAAKSKKIANKFLQANPGASNSKKRDKKSIQTGGHTIKASGDAYKSKSGKGDILKVGQHEPYAYIKLNPEMLNPKKKNQAVQSFSAVVGHGKKTDKRTGKRTGMLAGMQVKE